MNTSKDDSNTRIEDHAVVSSSSIPGFDSSPPEQMVPDAETTLKNLNIIIKVLDRFIDVRDEIQTGCSTPTPQFEGNTALNLSSFSEFCDSRSLEHIVSDVYPEVIPNIPTSKTTVNVIATPQGKCLPKNRPWDQFQLLGLLRIPMDSRENIWCSKKLAKNATEFEMGDILLLDVDIPYCVVVLILVNGLIMLIIRKCVKGRESPSCTIAILDSCLSLTIVILTILLFLPPFENFQGLWNPGTGVQTCPPSILVEGCTFQPRSITLQREDVITDTVNTALPQAGLNTVANVQNSITKPDTTILGENRLFHTNAHGDETSSQEPREVNPRQGECLTKVGGTNQSYSHAEKRNQHTFTIPELRYLFSVLLMLSHLGGFAVAANIRGNSKQCPPQQLIELGRRGVVRCADQGNASRVFWFNDANEVLIQTENGKLDGSGYLKGELNLEPNGSLVINSVDIQHESTYRVDFLDSDLKISSYQVKVTVYVPPRPPYIVFEGCKLSHPCSLTIRRGDAITCKVNGVRPQVDLNMVADSPIGIKTIPDTEIGEDGLFYTTICGYIDVNETTWGKNVTVTCQALGLATIGLTSDVNITVNTIGENCSSATTTIFPEQDQPRTVSIGTAVVLCLVSALMGGFIVFLCMRGKRCSDHNLVTCQDPDQNLGGI